MRQRNLMYSRITHHAFQPSTLGRVEFKLSGGYSEYGVPALAGGADKSAMIAELSYLLDDIDTQPAKAGTPYLADAFNRTTLDTRPS